MNLLYSTETQRIADDTAEDSTIVRLSVVAFVLGLAVNVASIFIGNPYTITAITITLALILTLAWAEYDIPWMLFVSVLAANPVNLSLTIAANLIFALWLIFLHVDYLNALPRWIFIPTLVALGGVFCSSVTWFFLPSHKDPLNQLGSIINFVLGPFLLVPIIYFRAHREAFFTGSVLLMFFVVPSMIEILLAYIFGHQVAPGSMGGDLQANLFTFVLGKTEFQFIRTHIGFLLASFLCVSIAVILCDDGLWARILAAVIAGVSFFLLMVTGSIASTIACACAVIVIFAVSLRFIPLRRCIIVLLVMPALLASIWFLSPKIVREYVLSRYDERFGGQTVHNEDREERWGPSARFILRNPAGVGWSLYVEEIKAYPHNDYLSYGIAYGVIGSVTYAGVLCALLWTLFRRLGTIVTSSQLTLMLAGIGVLIVIFLNSFTDHLTANRWYYYVVWSIVWLSYFCTDPSVSDV